MIKITISGLPGSGKSQMMNAISNMLTAQGKKHVCIEEVGENDFLLGKEGLDVIVMTKQKKE